MNTVEKDRRTESLERSDGACSRQSRRSSARRWRRSSSAITARSIRRTWRSGSRQTSTAPRSRIGILRRKREPGKARVRVFNPTIEEHGWQSTHTIIEIVNDDMPFLVDSVTMEVNRHGLTLHLIIHPLILVNRDADGHVAGPGHRRRADVAARIVHPRRSRPRSPILRSWKRSPRT